MYGIYAQNFNQTGGNLDVLMGSNSASSGANYPVCGTSSVSVTGGCLCAKAGSNKSGLGYAVGQASLSYSGMSLANGSQSGNYIKQSSESDPIYIYKSTSALILKNGESQSGTN